LLDEKSIPFLVVTNDASKSQEEASRRFGSFGLAINPEKILTSGMLVRDYYAEHSLSGARTMVLGTKDTEDYAAAAGAEVVPIRADEDIDVLIIGDEEGFEFYKSVVIALNAVFRRIEQEQPIHLLLPNPDLIYPVEKGRFSFAAGTIAAMIESAIPARFPASSLSFARLGKPYAPIFSKAVETTGTENTLMIGDQILTDIQGAQDFGLDTALVNWGVTDPESLSPTQCYLPDYLLTSFI
jgi:HAD superfamily hydrolase (TIGR01450 family)